MKTRHFSSICVGCVVFALAAALQVNAQQTAKPSVSAKPSVNLSGVWLRSEQDGRGLKRPQSAWSTEMLPFTPKGLETYRANKPGRGPNAAPAALENDPMRGANPPGLYRTLVYSRPIEIVQLPDKVIQEFAWGRIYRNIYTDGRPVPKDVPAGPYWYGHSVGKWEGNTLVVTTLGLDSRAWFDDWGTPISDSARVEERWERIASDKLQLKVTVNDPVTYSKPWTSVPVNFTLQHNVDPDEIILAPIDEQGFNDGFRTPATVLPK